MSSILVACSAPMQKNMHNNLDKRLEQAALPMVRADGWSPQCRNQQTPESFYLAYQLVRLCARREIPSMAKAWADIFRPRGPVRGRRSSSAQRAVVVELVTVISRWVLLPQFRMKPRCRTGRARELNWQQNCNCPICSRRISRHWATWARAYWTLTFFDDCAPFRCCALPPPASCKFPYTATINGKLYQQIEALFFAEIVTTTVIQLFDPTGHFGNTQDPMSIKMHGCENLRCVGVLAVVGIVFVGFLDLAPSLTKLGVLASQIVFSIFGIAKSIRSPWLCARRPSSSSTIMLTGPALCVLGSVGDTNVDSVTKVLCFMT
jgi:hypothetical protein